MRILTQLHQLALRAYLRRFQMKRCESHDVTIRSENDGVWAYFDRTKYKKWLPQEPLHIRELLIEQGLSKEAATRISMGAVPLSSSNNPDLGDAVKLCQLILTKRGYNIERIPVGLGLMRYFNAGTYNVLGGYVIILHTGLVIGLDLMNSWLMMFENLSKLEQNATPYRTRVLNALDFFAGERGFISRVVSDEELKEITETSRIGYTIGFTQRCWILLHEYGHAVLSHKHLGGSGSIHQEYEADEFATRTLIEHPPNLDLYLKWAPWAPLDFALKYLFGIRHAAESVYPIPKISHPSAIDRFRRTWEIASEYEGWGNATLPDGIKLILENTNGERPSP